MTAQTTGYLGLLAALGMMAGLLSPEISALPSWAAVTAPAFVGKVFAHFGVVVAAWVSGKIIPTTEKE